MNKETTLSDCMIKNKTQIPVIYVKEFIEKLKELIFGFKSPTGKYWYYKKKYENFMRQEIDKLAGEELIK